MLTATTADGSDTRQPGTGSSDRSATARPHLLNAGTVAVQQPGTATTPASTTPRAGPSLGRPAVTNLDKRRQLVHTSAQVNPTPHGTSRLGQPLKPVPVIVSNGRGS